MNEPLDRSSARWHGKQGHKDTRHETQETDMQNPFTSHARTSSENSRDSIFMKFSCGDYAVGRDNRILSIGMQLVANMQSYKYGFVHWSGGRPIESRMVAIASGESRPWRSELGHNDKDLWDIQNGEPVDPWRETESIEFADPQTKKLFLFSTSSVGGMTALRELSGAYGDELAEHGNHWPIVSLEVNAWESDRFGPQKSPAFPIVGWIEKSATTLLAPPTQRAVTSQSVRATDTRKPLSDDMSDEVPF
jgi:hypothetical protein